jgi:hypothetical protein
VFAPPEGRAAWSLRLLAGRLVELRVVESVSRETVRRVLKNQLKPWLSEHWCIPPKQSAEFVARMEDVRDVYHRPYDPGRPQVGVDEVPKQLVAEARAPVPARPEWHYTPKHGSWLNMAEVELSALGRQCLSRRIDSLAELARQAAAWEADRNERQVEVKWRFTTADARIKPHQLYPSIQA